MSKFNFRFLEIGVRVGSFEFFHVFAVPYSLSMRGYSSRSMSLVPLSVEDWLQTSFPTMLSNALSFLHPECLDVFFIEPYSHDNKYPVPITVASSSATTWVNPFVFDIASYFVNNYVK